MPLRKEKYKDMDKFNKTRALQRQRYYNKTAFIYPSRRWTAHEDALVLEHAITDTELSAIIQRSVRAIQVHRSNLKKKGN